MRKLLMVLISTVLLLAACSSAGGPAAQTKGLRVLATETFLGDIAQNIAGARLTVETLLPLTVDPHEFQPTPQDAARIADSQVLIVNGLSYETWLAKTLQNSGGPRLLVTATDGLKPKTDPSGAHLDGDPHLWMDPLNVIRYARNIRDGLTQADPAGKDIYAANTEAYIAKLNALDQWVKSEVAQIPPEKRLLVTNHDALGYFAAAYGFQVAGTIIPSVTDQAAPSAQQLAGLIKTIQSSGAPAIFLDAGENGNLAEQIASESRVKVVTDLYVESLSAPDGPAPTYIDMIKHDVTEIVTALK